MNPVRLGVVVITALLLQVSLFSQFSFDGARPDVMILVAVAGGFVAGAEHTQTLHGAAMTFFIYVAATCEIALAMALLVLLVKRRNTLDLSAEQELKG